MARKVKAVPEAPDRLADARQQAARQVESIRELVAAYVKADEADDDDAREAADTAIQEDALSVQVRSGWHQPGAGDEDRKPEEFEILLCTGGPAVRLVGDLDEHGYPDAVRCECRDWFTPWTDVPLTREEESDLLAYCQRFYFSD